MSTAVIVGGGISGLSAAYYISKQISNPKFAKIVVLEGSKRLGGWIQTTKTDDGAIFEHGPRTFRPVGKSGMNTLLLVEELGLSDKIIGIPRSSDAAKNRYIYLNGSLHALPSPNSDGMMSVFKKQYPFSESVLLTILKEGFRGRGKTEDESIDNFMKRRLNKEFTDYVFNPMFRGIFAGDVKNLSIRSCLPDIFKLEREHGSILKGLFKASKKKENYNSTLVKRSKLERWAIWSLPDGLQEVTKTLTDNLTESGKVEIHLDMPCKKINFNKDGAKVVVQTSQDDIKADHVICTTLSKNVADYLSPDHQQLKDELKKIDAVSCVVVNVEYDEEIPSKQGFGHLLPSSEDGPVLGVIYDSCTLRQHNRKDRPSSRFTVMLGGAWFDQLKERLGSLDEDTVKNYTIETLSKHLNTSKVPCKVIVSYQMDCIPQYKVGHYAVLDNIFNYISEHGLPLSLVGSSYRGVSLNDCIYNAKLEVERIHKHP